MEMGVKLREFESGKVREEQASGCMLAQRGVLGIAKAAKIDALILIFDTSFPVLLIEIKPAIATAVRGHHGAIGIVLRLACNTEIVAAVIQAISVDMIYLQMRRGRKQETVHQQGCALSLMAYPVLGIAFVRE